MTRSEWVDRVLSAWSDETCPRCGRSFRAYHVTDEGDVIGYCGGCDLERVLASEHWPSSFDPEPEENEDLPF